MKAPQDVDLTSDEAWPVLHKGPHKETAAENLVRAGEATMRQLRKWGSTANWPTLRLERKWARLHEPNPNHCEDCLGCVPGGGRDVGSR